MCAVIGVGAGLLGAAVIGGTATVLASNSAANATQNATNAAVNEQQSALNQQAALSAPYRAIGTGTPASGGTGATLGAIEQYQNLLGLGPGGAGAIQSTLAATPGYQFAQNQGIQQTTNAASAMGLGLSGNTLEGLDQFSTGLADQTYQQAVGNVGNAVQIGQAAAAGQAANIGQAAGNISGSLISQGNTIAGIDANEAASLSKLATGGIGQYAEYNILQSLANPSSAAPTQFNVE
jgi:hypothetical protein